MLTAALDEADIEVSSRYGTWDPDQLTIVPPAGPRPAPGDGDGDGHRPRRRLGPAGRVMPAAGPPRVVVCGLGPGGPDLVTAGGARRDRPRPPPLPAHHPPPVAGVVVGEATSFDALYDAADRIDDVYAGIVEALVAAASEHGEVLYAVPGSPVVAERTVELLVADERVAVELVPALSFVDLAWVRLGVDPVERGVRLVDGHRFAVAAAGERGPLLVGQCDDRDVLSEIKLAIGEVVDAVAVREATSGATPPSPPSSCSSAWACPTSASSRCRGTSSTGRSSPTTSPRSTSPPWPRRSRARWRRSPRWSAACGPSARGTASRPTRACAGTCIEEAYEVLEAIDHLDVDGGRGLRRTSRRSWATCCSRSCSTPRLAAEEGRFTLADVARGIATKLIGRHPHVFGDATADERRRGGVALGAAQEGREGPGQRDGRHPGRPAGAAVRVEGAEEGGLAGRGLARRWWPTTARSPRPAGGCSTWSTRSASTGEDPETELRLAAEHVRDRFRAQETAEPHESAG